MFDKKCGYRTAAEDSLYVRPDRHGRGVGTALLGDLLRRADSAGIHTVIARIDTGQAASLGLHLRHGFDPVGVLREVGQKFGRRLDVAYLQTLTSPDSAD